MIYPNNFEQKIGFDQIRHLLSGRCLSTLGRDKVEDMKFSSDCEEVTRLLDETMEFVRIIQEEDSFPYQHFFDVRPALHHASIVGMYMDEGELFDLRRSLETISQIIQFFYREEDEPSKYPNLELLAGEAQAFPTLIRRIDGIVNKFGKIKDNASPALANIRRELAATTGSISRTLNSILRSAQAEGIVEKDVNPTVRDGRLVIPVVPALKRRIKVSAIVARRKNEEPEPTNLVNPLIKPKIVSVRKMIDVITDKLTTRKKASLFYLLRDSDSKAELIARFMGILEMIKLQQVFIVEANPNAPEEEEWEYPADEFGGNTLTGLLMQVEINPNYQPDEAAESEFDSNDSESE